MKAHGTDLKSFSVQQTTCPCKGDPTQSRSCVHLEIVLITNKTYKYNLFGDESMTEQQIDTYLNSECSKIKDSSHLFKIVKESHPGYIGFTFAGNYKRVSGETA
ncbi:hypothetical protein [Fibrobacter sp. UWB5]|uniref:hypothetical protein n=1 Tax=Fibrobacter sp. UWB5 TaxID=1964360 RepID=UPI0011863A3C|nr:hypothetical protein [Fibrobacter sp. UWB5]